MLELVKAGGWPMIPLLLLAVVALAIIIERCWSLRRKEVMPPGLGSEVRKWATSAHLEATHIESLRQTSPLGELLAAALDVRHRPREVVRERIEDTGRHLVHRLERFLNTLGTIAAAGPLLGLLGTVIGMIQMFLGILDHGVGDVNQLAGGIGKALVCTATGMLVAIPALIFHRYFRGKVSGYVMEMEREAMALTDVLEAREAASARPPRVQPGTTARAQG